LRRATRAAVAAFLPLTLAACASSGSVAEATSSADAAGASGQVALTRVGEAVQVTENAESTHECEFVVHLPLSSASASDVNAMRALRNEAGRSGANLVLLVMETRTTIARAEGYLCAD
jgi:hypothetical protein